MFTVVYRDVETFAVVMEESHLCEQDAMIAMYEAKKSGFVPELRLDPAPEAD